MWGLFWSGWPGGSKRNWTSTETRMTTDNAAERDRQFASTLSRGIDILLSYRAGESALGNRDFVQRTGFSKSTVARLTHTLTVLGYLRHDAAIGKYRLGAAVISLGYPLLASMHIRQIARPLMKGLADDLRGAVSLGIRDRTNMIYVETARSSESLLMAPDIGAALPMLTTAIGNAWLCKATAADRNSVLNQLRVKDPEQFKRHYAAFQAAQKAYAIDGYCANRGEWHKGIHGVAAPLCKPVASNLFVFNCSILAGQGSFAERERDLAMQLMSLVRSIESLLGLR